MGTLKRFGRLRVFMLPGDHEPAHVHVSGPNGDVSVTLKSLSVCGSPAAIREAAAALDWIAENRDELIEAWKELQR